MLIEGYIEFENEIPVSSECLGKEYPITISGMEGLLATPRVFHNFNDERESQLGLLHSPEQGIIKYINEDIIEMRDTEL